MATQTKLTAVHFRQIYERSDDDADKYELGIEDMGAYHDWVDRHEGLSDPIWDEAEWVDRVLSTNYHDPESLDALLRLQESAKGVHVVIGEYNIIGYRLILDRAVLRPTAPPTSDFAALMPPELLGFVRNVSVGTPKVGELRKNVPTNLTPESAKVEAEDPRKDSVVNLVFPTVPPIGNDDTGFVFFQLGRLEAALPSEWSRRLKGVSEDNLNWSKSPHVLVIKVRDAGYGSSVYLMPTTHTRTEPFSEEFHRGFRVASTFRGVGSPTWFFSSPGHADINPLFEYVSAVLGGHGEGRHVVREYVPHFSTEQEELADPGVTDDESSSTDVEESDSMDVVGSGEEVDGEDADDEDSNLLDDLFKG